MESGSTFDEILVRCRHGAEVLVAAITGIDAFRTSHRLLIGPEASIAAVKEPLNYVAPGFIKPIEL